MEERCSLSSSEWTDSELTSMVDPLPSNQTTSPWNPSPRRTWQTCQPGCSTCYCTSRAMTTSFITAPVRKRSCLMPSHASVHILTLTSHWTLPFIMLTCPQGGRKHFNKALHEWSWDALSCWHHHHQLARGHQGSSLPFMPLLAALWDPHYWRWSCPPWKSFHGFSFRKGENTTTTTPVPSRNPQSPVAHTWMYLLTWYKQRHWRSCLLMWDLHLLPSPKCCSTSHSYANSIPPMADVCLRHLYPGRSQNTSYVVTSTQRWSSSDVFHLARATPPKSSCCSRKCSQSTEVLCSDNGPQYVSPQFAEFPQDVKPSLSTIKWIHSSMCKISETCTPMC